MYTNIAKSNNIYVTNMRKYYLLDSVTEHSGIHKLVFTLKVLKYSYMATFFYTLRHALLFCIHWILNTPKKSMWKKINNI